MIHQFSHGIGIRATDESNDARDWSCTDGSKGRSLSSNVIDAATHPALSLGPNQVGKRKEKYNTSFPVHLFTHKTYAATGALASIFFPMPRPCGTVVLRACLRDAPSFIQYVHIIA